MKAVLITFSTTVRVIIEGEDSTEEEFQNAFIKANETMLFNGPHDSFESEIDDTEIPFGAWELDEITNPSIPK